MPSITVYPGSVTQDAAGDTTWEDLANINNNTSTRALTGKVKDGNTTNTILATNFGINIPDGYALTGIEAHIMPATDAPSGKETADHTVRLIVNGSLSGDNLGIVNTYPSAGGRVLRDYGSSTESWGLSLDSSDVEASNFGVAYRGQRVGRNNTGNVEIYIYVIGLTLHYESVNTAPTITVAPTVSYGSLTRLGPNNTPATVTAEAEDPEETGVGELTAEIRTAASGAGTLVATQNVTSGVPFQMNVAHNASGLSEGTNNLFLRVHDGTAWSDDAPFTVLRDSHPPTVGTITVYPPLVTDGSG